MERVGARWRTCDGWWSAKIGWRRLMVGGTWNSIETTERTYKALGGARDGRQVLVSTDDWRMELHLVWTADGGASFLPPSPTLDLNGEELVFMCNVLNLLMNRSNVFMCSDPSATSFLLNFFMMKILLC